MAITVAGAAFTTSSTAITKATTAGTAVNTTVTAAAGNTFTPVRGETIVVTATAGFYEAMPSTITGGGLTWTKQRTGGATGTSPIVIWTAEVTAASPASVQIAVTYANTKTSATYGAFVVERYLGVKLPATPNSGATTTNDTTSPFSATITAPVGSIVSWAGADFAGVRQTPTYLSSAVENGQFQNAANGTLVMFSARQAVTAAGTQTVGWTSTSTTSQIVLAAIVLPAAPGFDSLVDTFDSGTLDTTKWTANGAGISGTQAYVNCSQNAGAAVYSNLRSAVTSFYWPETALVFEMASMIGAGNANAQFWIMDSLPAATVDRIGIEFTAATGVLNFRAQTGASYSAVGTEPAAVTYDPNIHRWARFTLTGGTVTWATSANGVTWTTQRTLASAPNWTTRPSAQASFEAFRTSGTNDTLLIDNVGSPRTVPVWNIVSLATGVASWSADVSTTPTGCVAQGYQDLNYNREATKGNGDASGLAWPIATALSPFGRSGRCTLVRVPDATKRYEMQPNIADWADGEQYWVGMAFAIGDDIDLTVNNYQVIWQSRPYDDRGSPPVAIELLNGTIQMTGGYGRPITATGDSSTPAAYAYSRTLLTAPLKRRWYNLVLFYGVWSALNSGRVDAWINGAKVLDNFVPPPGTNYPYQGSKTYAKCGMYHDATNRGGTIYIADHKVGTGYAGVDPTRTLSPFGGLEPAAALAA